MEGQLQGSTFVGDYYVFDANGNKIKRISNTDLQNAYLKFSGNVQKTLGKPLDGVKVQVERHDLNYLEIKSDAQGNFECKLELNFEYTIHFKKQGYNEQTILINTTTNNLLDTSKYELNNWKVVMHDNFAAAASNEIFGFLLNKPTSKIYYNKRKNNFTSDGAYINMFKKEFDGISKTTKLLLAKAAEDNKKLEIENLRIDAEKKEKEIELLTKAQQLKEAELKQREAEIAAQKVEAERQAGEAENEKEIHEKEKQIKDLELKRQQEKIKLQELQVDKKNREFERLALLRKMQELEIKQKENQLSETETALSQEKHTSSIKEQELEVANREKSIKERELKQNLIYLYIMLVVVLIIAVFAFFLYRNFKQKKKANAMLAKQATEIEEKSKIIELKNIETEQSIQYAKRIQHAILPTNDEIDVYLKDYFILYKPKDIVSGDFYFFSDQHADDKNGNGNVMFAVVDCTGHGVPGAFMSMIGSEKLKDACSISSHTGEILKQLNIGIKSALRQENKDGTRDGMDICLCSIPINYSKNDSFNVEYSGANRPFWLLKKNENSITEIKATKQAIGGLTPANQEFEQNKIPIQKGDIIYLTSDGFADQFGGPDKKKLMSKRFKEILISIRHMPMSEQYDYLIKYINNWGADTEQTDDILVFGLKA
ncbi:MAG: SpoIIE family protein phosphatase [Bacteroidetes bacterium]|nr:SpoIIE family protein phosphatase [Bacteroidota bacterium]